MKGYKYKKEKVVYAEGYNHYSKHKTVQVLFFISEAEKAILEDLMAVQGATNKSDFIRRQLFRSFDNLNAEQKARLAEVVKWRATEDRQMEN